MSAEQISDEHRVLRMRLGEQHSLKRLNGCSMKAAYRTQHWKGGAKLTMCRNMISKADEKKRKEKDTQTSTTNSTRTFFVNCWND